MRSPTTRGATIAGGTADGPLLGMNVFSARLVSSRPFELGGRTYDLRRLMPHGVTQWGTAVAIGGPRRPELQ